MGWQVAGHISECEGWWDGGMGAGLGKGEGGTSSVRTIIFFFSKGHRSCGYSAVFFVGYPLTSVPYSSPICIHFTIVACLFSNAYRIGSLDLCLSKTRIERRKKVTAITTYRHNNARQHY